MYLAGHIIILCCVRGKHLHKFMFSQSTFGDFDVLAGHIRIIFYVLEPHSETVMFFESPVWRNIFVDHIIKRSLDAFECLIWKRAGFGEPQSEMLTYWSVLFEETYMFWRTIFDFVLFLERIVCLCATFRKVNIFLDRIWRRTL